MDSPIAPINLDNIPLDPGVYLMKDREDKILYIGKAISLKARVKSYFQKSSNLSERIRFMLSKVSLIDWIVTRNEIEALALESNLIKKNKPPYNIDLKDDKHFPYLCLKMDEAFPYLRIVRKVKKDHGLYFGPYVPAWAVRPALKFIQSNFSLRQCQSNITDGSRKRPCLHYQMNRCPAPCAGLIKRQEYLKVVEKVVLFLKGRDLTLVSGLRLEMEMASEKLNYEEAARIRDQIIAIEQMMQKQKVISPDFSEQDVISSYIEKERGSIYILYVRGGKLVGSHGVKINNFNGENNAEILTSFLKQYYSKDTFVPKEIIIEEEIPEKKLLEDWLKGKKGEKVIIINPKRGEKLSLLEIGKENAKGDFFKEQTLAEKKTGELIRIKNILNLKKIPLRIEAFDLSHIFGSFRVGAMVFFENGEKDKSEYRYYRINKTKGIDDCGMLKEVLFRRYKKIIEQHGILPDLILVDGGRGQLNSALEVLGDLSIKVGVEIDVIGIAKGANRNNPETDEIFLPGDSGSMPIKDLRLLQEIRNEVHRYVLSYHIKLRKKETIRSGLESIPSIGKKTSNLLLTYFGSIENIKMATPEVISQVPGIGKKTACLIKDNLTGKCLSEEKG